MNAQPAERVDLDLIEALDFHHVPQCESQSHSIETDIHSGPATTVLKMVMQCCGEVTVGYRCEPFTRYALKSGWFRCECGTSRAFADVTILGRVGSGT